MADFWIDVAWAYVGFGVGWFTGKYLKRKFSNWKAKKRN